MKNKQKVAWMLICMMFIQLLPMQLFANEQSSVQKVEYMDGGVGHKIDNRENMSPTVGLKWTAPEPQEPTGATGGNDGTKHPVAFYGIDLKDLTSNGTYRSEMKPATVTSQRLEDAIFKAIGSGSNEGNTGYSLENGTLYRASVLAGHYHDRVDGSKESITALSAPVYFITDFDTKVQSVDKGLEISWEYIAGADYRITYAADRKQTKGEILASSLVEAPIKVKDAEIKGTVYSDDQGKQRVKYILEDVKPGEMYSLFVEVDGFSKNPTGVDFRKIEKNEKDDAAGPKVVHEVAGIGLEITPVGRDKIKIWWGGLDWAELIGAWKEIQIYEVGKKDILIAGIKNKDTENQIPEYSIVEAPKGVTTYRVKFIFDIGQGKELEVWSREEIYAPAGSVVEPYSPKIPAPYYGGEKNEKYVVSGLGDLKNIPLSEFKNYTFHANTEGSKTSVQLVWDAPKLEGSVDYNLLYDIWVSESLEELEGVTDSGRIVKDFQVSPGETDKLIMDYKSNKTVVGMKIGLDKYMDFTPNKTYYIKMVAKRMYGEYAAISKPTVVSIHVNKDGDISTPPTIGKPPLQIKKGEVKQTSITIEWRTIWQEIIAKDFKNLDKFSLDEQLLAEIGSSKVYVKPNSTTGVAIGFKEKAEFEIFPVLLEPEDVTKAIDTAFGGLPTAEQRKKAFDMEYYSRQITLGEDVKYELKVMPYGEVEKELNGESIENWVAKQKDNDKDWNLIDPKSGDKKLWKEYMIGDLEPNTRYVVMLRTYRMTSEGKKGPSYPSYIIATTLSDFVGPDPIPTVPTLQVYRGRTSDTSVTVYWEGYNDQFEYEVLYGIQDDPEQAKVQEVKNYNKEDGVTIYGLFPETTYNFWLKVKYKHEGKEEYKLSNPEIETTKPIQAPDIPKGLGPASSQSLKELNLDFKPVGSDYITVEWTKNSNDTGKVVEGNIEKYYEYDLEFADNVEFLDSIVVTVKDELGNGNTYDTLAKNIVKFNKLVANRPYYVRVKARIILTETELKKTIMKESEYSKWIRIFTKTSEGEYDGGENENIITYPDAIIEEYDKGEWTWEIVDSQKIIKDIKTSNEYFYTIRMEQYKNRYDAHLRHIKIPVTVMQALISSRMELKIITPKAIYEIPASAMGYYIARADAKDIVQIDLESKFAYDLREFAKPYPYTVVSAEELNVRLKSKQVIANPMKRFDGNIKVALKVDSSYDYNLSTFKTYTYDESYGEWLGQAHSVDTRTEGTYTVYSTPSVGIYTLYRIDTYNVPGSTNYAMDQLLASYNIEKLGTKYTKNQAVHSNQFVNLLVGLAQGHVDIDLDAAPSQNIQRAKSSMIYTENTSGYMTEEQAVHGVVRLYELKTGNRIKPSTHTFSGVSPAYKQSVSKAYALGLITDISPKAQINYGRLAELIQLVLP